MNHLGPAADLGQRFARARAATGLLRDAFAARPMRSKSYLRVIAKIPDEVAKVLEGAG